MTCGSTIKLTSKANGYKLHSHGVTYGIVSPKKKKKRKKTPRLHYACGLFISKLGSGSGQQSVTGFPNADDSNSFWIVEAASGKLCKRG